MKDKEPYAQYNGVVGTTYDADSYEEVITEAPDYMYDHIPGGVMMDDGEGGGHDYSKDYLTFVALEDTTFGFSNNGLQYSLDDGATWTTLAANTATPTISAGNKIIWKQTGLTPTSSGICAFSSTSGNFKAYGNIMSLYYGDNFKDQTDLTSKNKAFYRLFKSNTKLVDASNLILPATTLASSCYSSMFGGCTSLTVAPQLPATTLAKNCYSSMFLGCTSLTVAPQLPATTLANYCYQDMFNDCTSLTAATQLPATTLSQYCYYQMFLGCTSLTTAPQLPSTTLAADCYQGMFADCSCLTVAPQLPATTLASSCYHYMFANCTSLTVAPELPATTLAESCYYGMFGGCTSLSSITCLATDISASNCTNGWVNGVASSGTFIKAASMLSWTTGGSGIPTGWTVEEK